MNFDVFLSYSHQDEHFCRDLEHSLKRLNIPWFRKSKLTVFRDRTSMASSSDLTDSIKQSLTQSKYFVLIASPESARSPWVRQEIDYWFSLGRAERFLIVLLDGAIHIDNENKHIDWSQTDALPQNLKDHCQSVPFYNDFRFYRSKRRFRIRGSYQYKESAARLIAALSDQPLETVLNSETRKRRTALWGLTAITFFSLAAMAIAVWQWNSAERQSKLSLSRYMAAQARFILSNHPTRVKAAMHLATASLNIRPSREAKAVLRKGLSLSPQQTAVYKPNGVPLKVLTGGDGKLVILVNRDFDNVLGGGKLEILETDSMKRIRAFEKVNTMGVTISDDRSLLAVPTYDGEVLILNLLDKGKEIRRLKTKLLEQRPRGYAKLHWGHFSLMAMSGELTGMSGAFSADNRLLALIDWTNGEIFDLSLEKNEDIFHAQLGFNATKIIFSPDGRSIAFGGSGSKVQFISFAKKKAANLENKSNVADFVFSADGSRLYTGCNDRRVHIWNTSTFTEEPPLDFGQKITALALSPDGTMLAAGGSSPYVTVWQTNSGKEIARLQTNDMATRLFFAKKQRTLFVVTGLHGMLSSNATIQAWDVDRSKEIMRIPGILLGSSFAEGPETGTAFGVTGAFNQPDKPLPALKSVKNVQLNLYDWRKSPFQVGDAKDVFSAALSPTGKYIAMEIENKIIIYDTDTNEKLVSVSPENEIDSFYFNRNGNLLVTGESKDKITFLSIWKIGAKAERIHKLNVSGLNDYETREKDRFYFINKSGKLAVKSLTQPSAEHIILEHQKPLKQFAVHPSNPNFFLIGDGQHLYGYNADTGKMEYGLNLDGEDAKGLGFSPLGRYFYFEIGEHQIFIYDADSGEHRNAILSQYSITRTAWHPDETKIAALTGSTILGDDLTISVWDIGTGELADFERNIKLGYFIAYSPDGNRLYYSTEGDGVRYWPYNPDFLTGEVCRRLGEPLSPTAWRQFMGNTPYIPICNSSPGNQ